VLNIAIIEDDFVIKDTLVSYLGSEPEFEKVCAYESVEKFTNNFESDFQSVKPSIILLDINLPGLDGIRAIPVLRSLIPTVEIIMNSVLQDSNSIFRSLQSGASGYIDKETSLEKIKEAIIALSQGGSPMSPAIARKIVEYFSPGKKFNEELSSREKEIAHGIIDGLSYKLVADRIGISIDTVRKHIKSIYKKLQINSKGELIAKFHQGI